MVTFFAKLRVNPVLNQTVAHQLFHTIVLADLSLLTQLMVSQYVLQSG